MCKTKQTREVHSWVTRNGNNPTPKHTEFSPRRRLFLEKIGKNLKNCILTLIQEWAPAGATEEDAVLSIAKAVWRKRRVQKFLEVQLATNALNPKHPSYDEPLGLIRLVGHMTAEPEDAFEKYAAHCLRPDKIYYLRQKFPLSDFGIHFRMGAGGNKRNQFSTATRHCH